MGHASQTDPHADPGGREVTFACPVCHETLQAGPSHVGRAVKCPNCGEVQKVPRAIPPATPRATATPPGDGDRPHPPGALAHDAIPPGWFGSTADRGVSTRTYGFPCVFCASRLEASGSQAGHGARCPTCGSDIVVPILDPYGRLIDPLTGKVVIPPPHPVHAYAAAGERAPRVVKFDNGARGIRCPRCATVADVRANNCTACGVPFTIEGTLPQLRDAGRGYASAALVLGILSIPAGCTMVIPGLAIVFGLMGFNQAGISSDADPAARRTRGMSMVAIALAVAGVVLFFVLSGL